MTESCVILRWGHKVSRADVRIRMIHTSENTDGFSRIILYALELSDLYRVSFIHLYEILLFKRLEVDEGVCDIPEPCSIEALLHVSL